MDQAVDRWQVPLRHPRTMTSPQSLELFLGLHGGRLPARPVSSPSVGLRTWFARTTEHCDLIEMSLVDTWAATGAGAFSLSENGLYTTQGWHHFLSALTPNGILTVCRWFCPKDITETGRRISLAAAACARRGSNVRRTICSWRGRSDLA